MKRQLLYEKDYTFENDVVRIDALKLEHADYLSGIAQDEKVWRYFLEKGSSDIVKYCNNALENRKREEEYPFALFDKRAHGYAGMTRLYDYSPELCVIKMGHTWIGRDYWGTELNRNVKYLLFEFIFDQLNLERVGFGVHSQNIRSVRALQGIGCEQEGVLKSFLPGGKNGQRIDLLLFSLLKSEWNRSVKKMMKNQLQ